MIHKFANSSVRTALLATAAVVGLAALPSAANAGAYALAQTTIDNLIIFTDNHVGFNTFDFSSQASSSITNLQNVTLSSSVQTSGTHVTASYTNTHDNAGIDNCFAGGSSIGACVHTPGALSTVGSSHSAPANNHNDLTPAGTATTASYAFATSVIPDTAINAFKPDGSASGVTGGFLKQIAETNVANGTSKAQSGSSTQLWTFSINLQAGEKVNFTYTQNTHILLDATDPLAIANQTSASTQVQYTLLKCLSDGTGCVTSDKVNPNQDNKSATGSKSGIVELTNTNGVSEHLTANDGTGFYELQILVTDNVSAAAIPEPATLSILGAGLLGLYGASRRRAKKAA